MIDARDQHRVLSGSLTLSQTRHSCSWRGLAASNEIGAGADLQHEVDEVLELQVVDARADVDAVAGVPADPVRAAMPRSAWLSASTRTSAHLRISLDAQVRTAIT